LSLRDYFYGLNLNCSDDSELFGGDCGLDCGGDPGLFGGDPGLFGGDPGLFGGGLGDEYLDCRLMGNCNSGDWSPGI
jgi:hypothetical protein